MKKLGALIVSLGLAGASVMAANPVTSVNMVGYQNLNIVSNYNFIGNNWNLVGGGSAIPIQTLVNGAGLVASNDVNDSDLIITWDVTRNSGTGGYVFYYLWKDDMKWYEFMNDGAPTTNTIGNGQGFWIKHVGRSTNITFSGEVPVVATNVTVFGAGYTQFSSAYTVDMPLNSSNVIWTASASNDVNDSDLIITWDVTKNSGTGGYVFYYLWKDDIKWYEFMNDGAPTLNVIPLGSGAWFKHVNASAAKLVEVKPY